MPFTRKDPLTVEVVPDPADTLGLVDTAAYELFVDDVLVGRQPVDRPIFALGPLSKGGHVLRADAVGHFGERETGTPLDVPIVGNPVKTSLKLTIEFSDA